MTNPGIGLSIIFGGSAESSVPHARLQKADVDPGKVRGTFLDENTIH
ncbi:MAG: hypothetical protein ACERKS_00650 [Candidatus Bathyarchaeota archaeon]